MSWEAILWATNDAPVKDVNEFAVLTTLAEKADSDGCSAFPAILTIAERTKVDEQTVRRRLQSMERRGLLGKGNQAAAAYLRKDRRPTVYDLLIPAEWFPNLARINKERAEKGKPPITAENRPSLSPAPSKTTRKDKGSRRPRKPSGRGISETPRAEAGAGAHGVSLSRERGISQIETGCLTDTRTSPYNPVQEPVLPSGTSASTGSDGGTDGEAAAVGMNPGVALLAAIGNDQPAFLLTGKTLRDQGLTVAGMLLEGWTEQQLRQVIAGRALPSPVKASVGAIVARRLRDALSTPVPGSAPRLPAQAPAVEETFVPDSWSASQGSPVRLLVEECEGRDGGCGRPVAPGHDRCWDCLSTSV